MHPCFNSPAVALVLEESDRDGQLVEILSTKADDYLNIGAVKMAGAIGEPSAHYLFHRTLTELMRLAASHGFVMDAIDEPAFPPDAERGRRRISWGDFTKIPPVFGARLRPSPFG